MDGEFVCEATTGLTKKAVGGGNLLIMGAEPAGRRWPRPRPRCRRSMRCRTSSCRFPAASCARARRSAPSTRAQRLDQRRLLPDAAGRGEERAWRPRSASVLEIVIDGLTSAAVAAAMRAGLAAIDASSGRSAARVRIGAGNYGGKLGPAPLSSEGPAAVKPLVLTLRTSPDQRLDLSPLVPHRLRGRTAARSSGSNCRPRGSGSRSATSFGCAAATPRHVRIEGGAIGSIRSGRT